MELYPLVFKFGAPVAGNGFLAGVVFNGAALARAEIVEGEVLWWVDGVYPGGLAESGTSLEHAFKNLRDGILQILLDVAHTAKSFDGFRRQVEEFFDDCDEKTLDSYEQARVAVREGRVDHAGLAKVPNPKFFREVHELKISGLTPAENATFAPYEVAA